ncbi:hypothetical protein ACB092_05G085100 [Castanea dentata]
MDLPWICEGDFNEIVKIGEKMGGAPRRERLMVEFIESLDFCGFQDMGFVSSPFTWCNNRTDEAVTWIILDKGVATPSWSQLFPMVRVHHKQLIQAEALSMRGGNHEHVWILKCEVHELMVKEDCMWHQRSMVDWLRSGDMNTTYFHSHATQRNKRNYISKLVKKDGSVIKDENMIGDELVNYFTKIFTSAQPTNFDPILKGIELKVTPGMNSELILEFTVEAVEQALKQMKPLLALRPDGNMPKNLNHTFISLVPKIKSPEKAKDFRPISLCNVLYKIISKTIANHLKHILPKLVSETQSAFMLDRLISDNILKKLMEKLGFDNRWISLISSCIHSVSFSVMVNGAPYGHFNPNRGLCQGDPLSPYLFLLCAEDNNLLFCKASQNDCNKILEILQLYESASGQQINKDKTQLPTLVFLHLWDEGKKKASVILERGFGTRCKDRRKNSYHKEWGYIALKKLCSSKYNGGLGFKDIENFNIALLGKQVWRFLHNTDSLLYKVFKPKYISNCSILDEEVKTKRQVVRLGSRWRIGNENLASCIISPQRNFLNNTRVCALIDVENSCWLEDQVRSEFLPHKARAILNLPLDHGGSADKLIWSASKNGIYSIKIAYQVLIEERVKVDSGASNCNAHKTLW